MEIKLTKEKFEEMAKVCLNEYLNCEINKDKIINALSKAIPYPLLLDNFSFKVLKATSVNGELCRGHLCYDNIYVSIDIEEVKDGKNIFYKLLEL